jgi:ABC-type glycerol-3-phosphate transport system permease component
MASHLHAKHRRDIRLARVSETILIYTILLSGAVLVMIPFWWMVTTSLKSRSEVFSFPPTIWPKIVRWQNYVEVFDKMPLVLYFLNTVFLCLMNLVGSLLSASMVGFSFARLRWRGRELVFLITLATMMLPGTVTMIPRYLIYKQLHWLDTFYPLWVPSFFGSAFFIFLMRQFYTTINREIDDAARLDGCSIFGLWWRIGVPLTMPALATCGIFTLTGTWSDVMGPLIYLSSKSKVTLALGLLYFRGPHGTDWHYLMAGSTLAMLPVIVLFFFAQRYFIQGIVFTGVEK